MSVFIAIEQAGVIALAIVELADDVHRVSIGRPDAKCGAACNQIRTHRGAGMDMIEGGRHVVAWNSISVVACRRAGGWTEHKMRKTLDEGKMAPSFYAPFMSRALLMAARWRPGLR
jgi:hypothetical protein